MTPQYPLLILDCARVLGACLGGRNGKGCKFQRPDDKAYLEPRRFPTSSDLSRNLAYISETQKESML